MRFMAVVFLLVLAACTRDGNIAMPDGPPRQTLLPTSVSVLGQTFGADGSIWTPSGDSTLCGDDAYVIYYSNNMRTVHWTRYCTSSAFGGGTGGELYDGGIVNVFVQTDSGDRHLGNVTGDMSQEGLSADAPAGAYIKLNALANSGCSFARWNGAPAGKAFTNPLLLVGDYTITANFRCGAGFFSRHTDEMRSRADFKLG